MYFPNDPLVSQDAIGYYLSSTRLDVADSESDRSLEVAAKKLLDQLNGAAVLLTRGNFHPMALTGTFDHRTQRPPVQRVSITVLPGFPEKHGIDSASASLLLDQAESDPWTDRLLSLLAHLEPRWVWIDLWRIWDILRGFHPGPGVFKTWVVHQANQQAFDDFNRSANDPAISGELARHDGPRYQQRLGHNQVLGSYMPPDVATEFIKKLVTNWIAETTQSKVLRADVGPVAIVTVDKA